MGCPPSPSCNPMLTTTARAKRPALDESWPWRRPRTVGQSRAWRIGTIVESSNVWSLQAETLAKNKKLKQKGLRVEFCFDCKLPECADQATFWFADWGLGLGAWGLQQLANHIKLQIVDYLTGEPRERKITARSLLLLTFCFPEDDSRSAGIEEAGLDRADWSCSRLSVSWQIFVWLHFIRCCGTR